MTAASTTPSSVNVTSTEACLAVGARRRKKSDLPPVHPALADLALIDGPQCAAAAGCSISEWRERVRTGEAPAPVMRTTRCTRWRIADVRRYLEDLAQRAAA